MSVVVVAAPADQELDSKAIKEMYKYKHMLKVWTTLLHEIFATHLFHKLCNFFCVCVPQAATVSMKACPEP